MRQVDIVIGALSIVFAGFYLTQSFSLDFYQRSGIPGPGFLPTLLAVAIALLGLCLVATRLFRTTGDLGHLEMPAWGQVTRSMGVWLAFAAAVLIIEYVGFVVTSALLIGFLLLGIENLRSIGAVLTVILIPLTFYVVFVVLLSVHLPTGPWGF
jgi:putative tricarboxylic transport membrane protein